MTTGGPLHGCRVLELGSTVAGPFCGRLFADFGADVIKVEAPEGDPLRGIGRHYKGKSLWWASTHRNKRVIVINMKSQEGRDIVRRLMMESDVVVENFRPGQLEKWGLGYEEIHKADPRLIMVRISGFGQTGPYSDRPGFGIIGEALSGLRSITGDPDRPPARVATPLTDYLSGVYAAFGAMVALHHRERTGQGQCVDTALYESAFSLMESFVPAYEKLGEVPMRTGSRLPGHVPNNLFPTGDGSYIHIAAGNDSTFRRLAATMGREDLAADPRFTTGDRRTENHAALDALITAWTAEHALHELNEMLIANAVPAAPIYTVADTFADPQYKARNMLVDIPDDELGSITVAGIVPKLSETPGALRWAGRQRGADTRAVLAERLGLSESELDRLEAADAIASAHAEAAGD